MASGAPPQISVVLPTYNGSRYLAASVQSVIGQTFSDWELIIVDDCSTDATPEIIERFVKQDPRIRGIRHETNRKLPAALNTGFSRARGELFTWTSDDNCYLPSALADMLGELRAHSSADIAYSDYVYVDEDGTEISGWLCADRAALLQRNCVGSCFLYRRAVHERLGGYREDLFCVEDYDFWIRASQYFAFHPMCGARYRHRVHGESLSTTQTARIDDLTPTLFGSNMACLWWVPLRERRALEARLCCWTLHQGKMAQARVHFLKSFPVSLFALLHCDSDELFQLLFGLGLTRTKRRIMRGVRRRLARPHHRSGDEASR